MHLKRDFLIEYEQEQELEKEQLISKNANNGEFAVLSQSAAAELHVMESWPLEGRGGHSESDVPLPRRLCF